MNKFLSYFLVALGILGLAGVGVASAHGWFGDLSPEDLASRFQTMFEKKAELLGITVDEFKAGWAEGKNLQEIAEEHGITQEQLQERMKQERINQMTEQLNILVENGIITQAQADQRLSFMQDRFENMGLNGGPCGGRGGGGWRMGF